MYKELAKENKNIELRGIERCPDTLVLYKGKIIGKYSHTKGTDKRILKSVERQVRRNMERIDKGKEVRYGGKK